MNDLCLRESSCTCVQLNTFLKRVSLALRFNVPTPVASSGNLNEAESSTRRFINYPTIDAKSRFLCTSTAVTSSSFKPDRKSVPSVTL